MVELRESTSDDIVALFGCRHKYSMRGITAVIDGVPAGIAGIYYDGTQIVAFSRINPELRVFPFAIYKAARMVAKMIDKSQGPIYAVADPNINGSAELLEHLGFDHIGPCSSGEVYKWNQEKLQQSQGG